MDRKKGLIPWNKDRKTGALSESHKKLISIGLINAYKNGRQGFKKNHIPWNKNLKYDEKTKGRLNMAGLEVGRGYFRGKIRKETYPNLHYWVRKHKPYPQKCNDCGKINKRLEWSNIDHRYRLVLDDYVARCKKCHVKYDFDNNLINKERRYKRGGDI